MKLQKIFLVSVILFAFFQIYFGQEKPKAVLIDEFPAVPCDEFSARTDNFLIELHNNSDSQGYAVISGSNKDLRRMVGYELLTKGTIALRNFDKNRIVLVRGEEAENFQIQFWRVPPGAEKPDFKETKWNFVFPPEAKPLIFHDDVSDGVCPTVPFEMAYTEYLNANPQSRGHIVIYTKSLKKYNKFKREAQILLKNIPFNHLRFFRVKKEHSNNYATIEYWLVPRSVK